MEVNLYVAVAVMACALSAMCIAWAMILITALRAKNKEDKLTQALLDKAAEVDVKDVVKEEPKKEEKPKPIQVKSSRKETKPNISAASVEKYGGEIWVKCPIEGFESKYVVSSYGRVKKIRDGSLLGQTRNSCGKLKVNLVNNKIKTGYTVERLVALSFLNRPAHDNGKYHRILHIDGDIDNNRSDNLAWR